DLVARYGGEEFAVVMPDADLGTAVHIAERLRCRIAGLTQSHEAARDSAVTASIGVAVASPSTGGRWEELVKRADQELYDAKRAGPNQVRPIPPDPLTPD